MPPTCLYETVRCKIVKGTNQCRMCSDVEAKERCRCSEKSKSKYLLQRDMERIVKRSELHSGESSPDDSPRNDHIGDLIHFELIERAAPQIEQDVEDDDEMDFCLFAPTPGTLTSAQPISRIRLKSPTPSYAEPGLENPHRDRSYYFTQPLDPDELERFASTAVCGHDIKARSCSHCPGSSYAWKVQDIKATKAEALLVAKATAMYDDLLVQQEPLKRKRPGKQARVKSRIRQALLKATQIEDQKAAELKGAADREKRTRRNREKKTKKKIREKAKKAAAVAGGVESDGTDSEDDSS